jgi:hypothetical protein
MSDLPQLDTKDSPLDKGRYKEFIANIQGGCFESTDPETFTLELRWYCVFSMIDNDYICRELTIPEAFLIDPNLEGYATKEECKANLCGRKWYCEFNPLDQEYTCFERRAIENQDKIGYNTKEECEANLCATKWYCTFDPDAPIGLDGEDTRWKCEQKQVITADEGQIGYDSKEECESQSLCATKWFCEPDNENGGFKCSQKIVGVATDEVTGNPNAVGYDTQEECLENCPFPNLTEEPTEEQPTETPTESSTETPTEFPTETPS